MVIDASNPFFTDVARGIEQTARGAGVALYLCNSDGESVREADYLDLLLEHRVRGVLITPVNQETAQLEVLAKRGMPVVLVDRSPGGPWCSVGVDDVEGGGLAVTHLCEQGHRRIAFVGGPVGIVQVADRLDGARKAIAGAGLPPDSLSLIETSALNVAEGRRAGERLMGLPRSTPDRSVLAPMISSRSGCCSR